MPELPEVETVRTRLAPDVEGRTIVRARVDDTRLVRPELPELVAAALTGASIERVDRRGKYLLLRLAGGETLAVHLRMTGNLLRRTAGDDAPRFVRAELELDDGSLVAYTDIRRFGTWELLRDAAVADEFIDARLGPEPFSDAFTPAFLYAALHRRNAPVKAVLLDQRVVAGLGNIYADEALWAAQIHPETPGLSPSSPGRRTAARRDPRGARCRHRGAGRVDPRLPDARRRTRLRAGAVRRLRTHRRAVPALRHAHPAPRRRAARDAHLPALPAGAARAQEPRPGDRLTSERWAGRLRWRA